MPDRIKQTGKVLDDPTSFGHSFMPPWSVTCRKCGASMVSYANEPTAKCTGCGGEVKKSDPSMEHLKKLPAHGAVDTQGNLTPVKPKKEVKDPGKNEKPLVNILKEQSKPKE